MKTAQEFLNDEEYYSVENSEDVRQAMVDFAKYHVELALKEASEEAGTDYDSAYNVVVDKDSILNSYNLDNIK